jgi:hypothetical protein
MQSVRVGRGGVLGNRGIASSHEYFALVDGREDIAKGVSPRLLNNLFGTYERNCNSNYIDPRSKSEIPSNFRAKSREFLSYALDIWELRLLNLVNHLCPLDQRGKLRYLDPYSWFSLTSWLQKQREPIQGLDIRLDIRRMVPGMIPSNWVNALKPSRASTSVAASNLARFVLFQKESSGPTPL